MLRWRVGLIALLTAPALVGCGGGSDEVTPDPSTTTDQPQVSVDLTTPDSYAKNTDGLVGVQVAAKGSHPASATVTVRFDVPAGKLVTVAYQATQNEADGQHWPALKLSSSPGPKAGLDTLTGSYSVPLHDGDLWRFSLRPQFGPSAEIKNVPVHVSLAEGGQTVATASQDATLTAVTAVRTNTGKTAWTLYRDGRWAEVDYTLTNVSTQDARSMNVGLAVNRCNPDETLSCQADGSLLGAIALQKFDKGRWVSLSGSNGQASRVLTTSLKAGADSQVRLRLAPGTSLAKDVDRAEVVLAWAAPGADGSFNGTDASDFTIH
ncbi:hypothetical protein OHA18_20315 [Kribbella sp. NBC_00709]|uniref:hypothetical protein n=1 Tax=Kribbella sp. NBC_00709 TaxID=2975972 RepID=UPI002E28C1CD|nr:hypothetical protein [Kribbella sp. NBC_00709]